MILFDKEEFENDHEDYAVHGFVVICNGCGFKSYRKNRFRDQDINHKCSKCGCDLIFGKPTSWFERKHLL